MVSCEPEEQWKELVASSYGPFALGLGSNIGPLPPDELRERVPSLAP